MSGCSSALELNPMRGVERRCFVKRRIKSAGAVRAAASAAIALEKLELRRLLSGSYQLDKTIVDSDGGYAYENFGRAIATQGTLALIGSTGETTSITHDGGST